MSFLYSIYRHKFVPPADPTTSFAGQTIIVTGSNTGLGFQAAIKFAALGATRLILGVRDPVKGAKAKEDIEHRLSTASGKSYKCTIEVWPLDMNSYDSIKSFAKRAETELDRIDVAVLNAGVYRNAFSQSQYGWEETLQVNVLSTTLLALLLLPALKNTGSKRKEEGLPLPTLELVSSGLHQRTTLPEDTDTNFLKHFNTAEAFADGKQYSRSKLFLMYALGTLQNLALPHPSEPHTNQTPDVWVVSVCPGACMSELGRDFDTFGYRLAKQFASYVFFRTTEEGARSLVSGATLGERGHGRFWQHDEIKP